MYFKNANFKHEEEDLHKAFGIEDDMYIRCRERVFFATIVGYLLCLELYGNKEDAPRELTTVTGDLQRTLNMVTNEKEYDITLLHFMNYHQIAKAAVHHHYRTKDEEKKEEDTEDQLKQQIAKLVKKMIKKKIEREEGVQEENSDIHAVLDLEDMLDRLEKVKQSNKNFDKYMRLMGYQSYNHSDVDDLLNKTLAES